MGGEERRGVEVRGGEEKGGEEREGSHPREGAILGLHNDCFG